MSKFLPFYIIITVLLVALGGALGVILMQQGILPGGQTVSSSSQSATSTLSASSSATTATAAETYLLYFVDSKKQDAAQPKEALSTVELELSAANILSYLLEQVIAGPTDAEIKAGLSGVFDNRLSGESNCGGANLTVTVEPDGLAKVQFCRAVKGVGTFADGILLTSVGQTALQLEEVTKVQILDAKGDCLFDESGENICKQRGFTFEG